MNAPPKAARGHTPEPGPSIGLAAILLLTLAAYAPTLLSSFHFDDFALLSDPAIASPNGWWRVFRLQQTRPLTYLTFWLNYQLGGTQPLGYHVFNLIVHIAAALAVWAVARRILLLQAALVATAVFALHPIQSEAVAYVFARATLLTTLFCLLCWRDWLDGRLWRAAAWFVAALLAKEECAAFPFFLLSVEWVRERWRKQCWPPWTAMCCAAIAAGTRLLYVAGHIKGSGIARAAGITPWVYLLSQPKSICRYLLLFICPIRQNFDHDVKAFAGFDWPLAASLAAILALVGLAFWRRRQEGLWILGALVLLAPSSSFIPAADLMFEHRMYLPLVSLSLAAGAVVAVMARRPGSVGTLVPLAVGMALTGATWARGRVWSSEESLWADAAAKSPGKVRPKLELARALARTNPERAVSLLEEGKRLDPANPEPYTQMGSLLLDQRDPLGALAEFDEALRREQASADAHSNRGTALFLLGRLEEGEAEFLQALALDPCHPNARHNLVLLYSTLKDESRRRAIEAPPSKCGPQ